MKYIYYKVKKRRPTDRIWIQGLKSFHYDDDDDDSDGDDYYDMCLFNSVLKFFWKILERNVFRLNLRSPTVQPFGSDIEM